MPTNPAITVDAGVLSKAIRAVARLASKNASGGGVWTIAAAELEIDWAGSHLVVDATDVDADGVDAPSLIVTVAEEAMRHLGRALPKKGDIVVQVKRERLYFGGHSVACTVQDRVVSGLLALNATPLDVLMLRHQHSQETIDAAGLSKQLASTESRARASIVRAGEALGWMGVDGPLLETWIAAHLAARAKGRPTFDMAGIVVVEPHGQVRLFE